MLLGRILLRGIYCPRSTPVEVFFVVPINLISHLLQEGVTVGHPLLAECV